jgi:hypothetical protein
MFGFRESLYATTPIPPTEEGQALLVGRQSELARLKMQLASTALHPCIEGDNGVGKTSLVSVAGYELSEEFRHRRTSQAMVPLARQFQLTPDDAVEDFRRRVLFAVAQGFVEHYELLKSGGLDVPDVVDVRKWLTQGMYRQRATGLSFGGFGGSLGRSTSPNTSAGYSEAGFASTVESWLRRCFPVAHSGGLICVVDNLELLETSQRARSLLESMRDEVLGLPGLRWVLCGSRGIVRTAAASSRLEGRLADPMELGPLPHDVAPDVISARRRTYSLGSDAVPPVGRRGFRHLYDVLNQNLRNALKYADDFSLWLASEEDPPWTRESNDHLLEVWLTTKADEHHKDTHLGEAAWRVFDRLCELGGNSAPGDHEAFGYSSSKAMRLQIKSLEEVNLVLSAVDQSDKRKRTISITPRGWLVLYARSGYLSNDNWSR